MNDSGVPGYWRHTRKCLKEFFRLFTHTVEHSPMVYVQVSGSYYLRKINGSFIAGRRALNWRSRSNKDFKKNFRMDKVVFEVCTIYNRWTLET